MPGLCTEIRPYHTSAIRYPLIQFNTVPTTYLRRYFERLGLRYKFLSMRRGAAVLTEGQIRSFNPKTQTIKMRSQPARPTSWADFRSVNLVRGGGVLKLLPAVTHHNVRSAVAAH